MKKNKKTITNKKKKLQKPSKNLEQKVILYADENLFCHNG